MTTQSNHSLIPSKFFSQLCGLIAAGLGMVAIVGWLTGWRILTGIRADYIPMAPNTALSFIVLGVSLYALITERKPALKLSRIGAAVIFVLSLIRFTEISVNINLNVDRWIFQVPSDKLGLVPVGQMVLPTALNFLFASVALFLASSLKRHWSVNALTRILAGLTTFIGLAFCLGYIYGAPLLYGGTTIPMALNTAISFFVLGLGLVANNVSHDTAEWKRAAEALRKAHDKLEVRIAERTTELDKANEALRADITERKQAEEALHLSQISYQGIFDGVTDAIYLQDEDGHFLHVNRAAELMYGYPRDYFTGKTPEFLSAPAKNNLTLISEAVRKAFAGEPQYFEFWGVHKDGTIFPKDVRLSPGTYFGKKVVIAVARDITERKRAEEVLRRTEDIYRRAIASADAVPYQSHYASNSYEYMGEGIVQLIGYTAEEMNPILWRKIIKQSILYGDAEELEWDEAVRQTRAGKFQRWRSDNLIVTRDGQERWIADASVEIRNAEGVSIGSVGILMDITERKQAEEQIAMLAHAVRSISECVSITDMDDTVLFVNEGFLKTYGYEEHELLGNHISIVRSPNNLPDVVREILPATLRGGWQGELVNRRKDGTEFPIALSASKITDKNGKLIGLVRVAADITERKKVEAALRESEKKYREVVENASDVIYSTDNRGNFTYANAAALRSVVYLSDEITRLNYLDLVLPEHRARVKRNYLRQLLEKKPTTYIEYPFRTKSGEVKWFGQNASLTVEGDAFAGFHVIARDITERKQAEEALRESEERMSTLIGASTDAIFLKDGEGRWLLINHSAAELFDLQGKEYRSKTDLQLGEIVPFHREALAYCRSTDEDTWQRKSLSRSEETIPQQNAPPRILDVVKVPLFEEDGRRRALVVVGRDITERKRVEEDIRQSHEKYEELVNSIEGIVWEADARTFQFSFVSKQAERLLGYPTERWITEPSFWKNHIHPDDREWVVSFCINATAEKTSHQFDYRMIAADGHVVWLRDIVVVVLKDEQPEMLRGVMVDITERKRAEQEREVLYAIGETVNTTASLDELLQSIHHNIKRVMYAENCYVSLYEYDAGTETISFPLFVDQFDPTPTPRAKRRGLTEYVLRTANQLLLTPELLDELVRNNEVEIIGTPPESWLGVPLFIQSKPIGVLVVQSYEPGKKYTDREKDMLVAIGNQAAAVIERKRAQEDLQRSFSLLTATLESTADGILVVDTEGKIVSFNQKFVEMWRIPGSVIASRDDNQALEFVLDQLKDPENFLKKVRELYADLEAESGDILEFRDGRVFDRYSHPQWLAGTAVGRVWSFRDITERRKLEAQFLQAQKLESMGTLSGGIAHDFNNILGIILGHASILERGANRPQALSTSVEAINKAVRRGADLVKQLMTFARKTDTLIESVNANDVVEELLHMLRETFPKTITFPLQLERALPSIHVDRGQLYQILLNLCVNARDAMPSGGTLSITTTTVKSDKLRERFPKATAERYLAVSVADTGAGIDRATIDRIFDPFFTTKEIGKGTGLGLAVVYGAVQTHHGFIDVESEVGRGTTFHLYFPVHEQGIELENAKAREEVEVQGGTETILVVEDEELLLELVQSLLESKGYNVLTAKDGVVGIEMYQTHQKEIAVVLSDMGLPLLSGQDVIKRIREINPEAKVIMASGFVDPETKSEMYKAGAKRFIQKPYASDEVLRKIREVIDTNL